MKISGKKRILIIRLSSLGDVILTTPVVRSLKTAYPEMVIDFLVRPEYKDVYLHNPHIDKILEYEGDELSVKAFREHIKKSYDLVLDLQNNKRSHELTRGIKIPVHRYKKNNIKKWFLVHWKINRFKKILSIPEKYIHNIEDLKLDEQGAEVFTNPDSIPQINNSEKYVGFAPGSKHITKMWPADYYIRVGNLLNNLGYKIVLFGGKDDADICRYISIYIKDCINLAKENNILQMQTDMKKCEFIICNDSGLMHLATTVNIPVITFFGSTVKEFGFSPYNANALVLENKNVKCRPCSHIGKDYCPKKHFNCMKTISPESVVEVIQKYGNQ